MILKWPVSVQVLLRSWLFASDPSDAVSVRLKCLRCCVSSCSMVSDIRSSAGLLHCSPCSARFTPVYLPGRLSSLAGLSVCTTPSQDSPVTHSTVCCLSEWPGVNMNFHWSRSDDSFQKGKTLALKNLHGTTQFMLNHRVVFNTKMCSQLFLLEVLNFLEVKSLNSAYVLCVVSLSGQRLLSH